MSFSPVFFVVILLSPIMGSQIPQLLDQYSVPSYQYEQNAANYDFQWGVADGEYGNEYGHAESRKGDRTEGFYHTLLPDGRRQRVDYYVDGDSGFVAHVSYEGEATPYVPPKQQKSSRNIPSLLNDYSVNRLVVQPQNANTSPVRSSASNVLQGLQNGLDDNDLNSLINSFGNRQVQKSNLVNNANMYSQQSIQNSRTNNNQRNQFRNTIFRHQLNKNLAANENNRLNNLNNRTPRLRSQNLVSPSRSQSYKHYIPKSVDLRTPSQVIRQNVIGQSQNTGYLPSLNQVGNLESSFGARQVAQNTVSNSNRKSGPNPNIYLQPNRQFNSINSFSLPQSQQLRIQSQRQILNQRLINQLGNSKNKLHQRLVNSVQNPQSQSVNQVLGNSIQASDDQLINQDVQNPIQNSQTQVLNQGLTNSLQISKNQVVNKGSVNSLQNSQNQVANQGFANPLKSSQNQAVNQGSVNSLQNSQNQVANQGFANPLKSSQNQAVNQGLVNSLQNTQNQVGNQGFVNSLHNQQIQPVNQGLTNILQNTQAQPVPQRFGIALQNTQAQPVQQRFGITLQESQNKLINSGLINQFQATQAQPLTNNNAQSNNFRLQQTQQPLNNLNTQQSINLQLQIKDVQEDIIDKQKKVIDIQNEQLDAQIEQLEEPKSNNPQEIHEDRLRKLLRDQLTQSNSQITTKLGHTGKSSLRKKISEAGMNRRNRILRQLISDLRSRREASTSRNFSLNKNPAQNERKRAISEIKTILRQLHDEDTK